MLTVSDLRSFLVQRSHYAATWRAADAARQIADYCHELRLALDVLGGMKAKLDWVEDPPGRDRRGLKRIFVTFCLSFRHEPFETSQTFSILCEADRLMLDEHTFGYDDIEALTDQMGRKVTDGLRPPRPGPSGFVSRSQARWADFT